MVQCCLFNFHIRNVTGLKKVAELCGFQSADKLQENLRNRLICGINDEHWQKCLLVEDNSDCKMIYDLALTLEAAEKTTKELKGTAALEQAQIIHKIYGGWSNSRRQGGLEAFSQCSGTNNKVLDLHNPGGV